MLKYSSWNKNQIRVSVHGKNNMSWAIFDFSGNIIKECNKSHWLFPGLTDAEKKEAIDTISKMQPAPFNDAYLRFNDIPKCGYSKNHATGEKEKGTSCYAITWDLINGCYKRTGGGLDGAMITYAIKDAPIYFISGEEVGAGSDGEPCLINVKILSGAIFDKNKGGFIIDK